MKQKLIIAPHVDDEILGCGGILTKKFFILHCGLAENQDHGKIFLSREARLEEFEYVREKVGFEYEVLKHPVNNMETHKLIKDIENIVNRIRPREIYIPAPSYNQDHKAVYDACLIALRPHDVNFFVKRVLVYEQPQDLWESGREHFVPNTFTKINIDKKIDLYRLIKSQIREHRGVEHLRSLAKLRGAQSNCNYSEGFKTIRWVK
tara:strand:+ start:339 stop:956 length:618 start_codon:yes stop_codon:yes gene_type:complete